MSALEMLTRESFEALEVQQARHAIQRLDTMLGRLQDLDDFLTVFIEKKTVPTTERKTSIPAR